MSRRTPESDLGRIGLSENDLARITAFASTPKYARTPEMLLPEGSEPPEE